MAPILHKLVRKPRAPWSDIAIVTVLLAVVNLILHPEDFGWTRLNPSPFLLLPILVGSCHGSVPGAAAGALASALVLGHSSLFTAIPWRAALFDHIALLAAFPIAGGICGEIHAQLHRRRIQLEIHNEHLAGRMKKLDGDLYFLRESKAEVERVLATHDVEIATLDNEIRRLMESTPEELYPRILFLLNRQTRVSSAGLYLLTGTGPLERKAFVGSRTGLPETLDPDALRIVALALEHKRPVSVPDFWDQKDPTPKEHLAAVPILDGQDAPLGLILITDIPFIALHRRSLQMIHLICRWAGRILDALTLHEGAYRIVDGVESQRVFTESVFRKNLDLAVESRQAHNIPSAVALLQLPGESATLQPEFERALLPAIRAGDYAATIGLPCPHLAVLLPLTGERGAESFLERIQAHARRSSSVSGRLDARCILIEAGRASDQIWSELTQSA